MTVITVLLLTLIVVIMTGITVLLLTLIVVIMTVITVLLLTLVVVKEGLEIANVVALVYREKNENFQL